jgi:hypothetical protein
MSGAIPSLPHTPSCRGAQLKHRDNFTFTFIIYDSEAHPASYPMGTRGSSPGVKRPGRGAIPPFPRYASMAWCLAKAQEQLYFTLLYS